MKRFLAWLLALLFTVSALAACSKGAEENTDGGATGGTSEEGSAGGGVTNDGADTEHKGPEPPKEAELFYELNDDGTGYIVVHNATPDAIVASIPATYKGKPVVAIGDSAFRDSATLQTVTLPDSITEFGACAFFGCQSLLSFSLPASLTVIGDFAFYDCYNLASFTASDTLVSIGTQAFYGTAYYNNAANWENDVLYFGSYLLCARPYFSGMCTVREGTAFIANAAFSGCEGLASVAIPKSVTRIGMGAFFGCGALTAIRYAGTASAWETVEKGMYFDMDAGDYTVICSDGELSKE